MRRDGRALLDSFVLHGLLTGGMIAMAVSLTPPPQTIRLDFCMLEQTAAPAAASPVPPPSVASPSVPHSQSKVQPAIAPPPKPVPARIMPAPVSSPPSLPAVTAPNVEMSAGLEASKDTGRATPAHGDGSATAGTSHEQISGKPGPGEQTATEGEGYRRANFGVIRDSILANLRYPMLARRRGWSGLVEVTFMIAPDGSVNKLRIQASSGFPVLDDEALAAIRRSAPFPPPRMAALLVMPVTFQLE